MAILDLVIAPDPRLKQISEHVDTIDDTIRCLMNDMLETMYTIGGIGLAAVQVGVHKRILVMDIAQREGEKEPIFMVNPKILQQTTEFSLYNEGCLSFPDLFIEVKRPAEVRVQYLDYDGNTQELTASGLIATCVQHEIDHLNGIVFIDHLSSVKRDIIIRKMRKVVKKDAS